MRPWSAVFLLALAACNGTSETDPGDPDDIDGAVDGGAAAYTDVWGIDGTDPDCEAIDLDGCAEPVVMEGDTRFYAGELVWDSEGNVTGYEAKVVYPNAQWSETSGAADCLVVWQLSGTVAEGAGAYGFEFTLAAARDDAQSTCLPAYVSAEANGFEESYLANVNEAGEATVYFPSGTLFANGIGSSDGDGSGALAFASDGDCEWLGQGECQQ